MLSKSSSSNTLDFNQKYRNFELNTMTNLEKKYESCDRPALSYVTNNSGKQVTAYFNTIVYEILKNNALQQLPMMLLHVLLERLPEKPCIECKYFSTQLKYMVHKTTWSSEKTNVSCSLLPAQANSKPFKLFWKMNLES